MWSFVLSLMLISSWNVNSIRARIENIKEYLNKFSPDILMMQEIKTPNDTYPYEIYIMKMVCWGICLLVTYYEQAQSVQNLMWTLL